MTYVFSALLIVVVVGCAYARRRFRGEAAAILIVALPIALFVPYNVPHWYRSLVADQRLSSAAAAAVAPPVIAGNRNLPLARRR